MKVLLFANTDWYLYNFRRDLAQALRARGDEVLLVSPGGEYAPRLTSLGFRWVEFPFSRRGMNPLAEAGAILRLVRLLRAEKPHLVHAFTIKCVLYGSLAARWAGIHAVVNSITGLGWLFMPGGFFRSLLRSFIQLWYRWVLRGTQVLFENEDDRQAFLASRLTPPEASHYLPGVGVDMQRFAPLPFPPGEPVVLVAARLLWDKGIREYIEAARSLRRAGVRAHFLLAGRPDEGNPTSIPASQIDAWQQEGVVEWLGWIEDMAQALASASIICLPSYREGLPTMLIEAAACARPVVTTDVPGCRSAVRPGESGLLVPPRDSAALAQALGTLISDPALCARMGAAGRRMVAEEYSSASVLQTIFRLYSRALERQEQ